MILIIHTVLKVVLFRKEVTDPKPYSSLFLVREKTVLSPHDGHNHCNRSVIPGWG